MKLVNALLLLVDPFAAVLDQLTLDLKLAFGALSPNRLAFELRCEEAYVGPHSLPHDLPDEGG